MGCDIHMWIEKRDAADAAWQLVAPSPGYGCTWCEDGTNGRGGECWRCKGSRVQRGFDGRNYNLFGMLANVRNGSGFAGVRTGDGYEPIDEPRGWPADLSEGLAAHLFRSSHCEDFDRDDIAYPGDHSESWLTVAEIDAYFARHAQRGAGHVGIINMAHLPEFQKNGRPSSWCGGVSGLGIVVHEGVDAAARLLEGRDPTSDDFVKHYVRVTWSTTYVDDAGHFLTHYLPAVRALASDPSNVRLVFNFDS